MDINRPLYGGEGGGSHAKKDMVGGGY